MGILNAYAPGDRALTPQAVAERVGLPLPTVYRLMHSLAAHGMLEKTGAGFRLGLALLRLGARVTASIDLRQVVTPYLESLNAATGENAELHVLRGETRVSIESVLSAQNLRPIVQIGETLPIHVGASGRALLAWMPAERAIELAKASAHRFGGLDHTNWTQFNDLLAAARRDGWTESESERADGVAALAAPIFGLNGTVAGALVLSGPSARLTARVRAEFAPLIRQAGKEASLAAGFIDTTEQDERARGGAERD
ncbi:IclR family transcriptional regulator [Spelaeicoccus albus]|uniref:DNA-binding IclR family transcriptional regulator n=1 Tax=Spelaeicoccus albus TaxID=1280376 RepID=A0A7Z0ACD0_9MICO|nr:IclR family transcriptional regulator [Spelaeicoccus albus]NYI67123.1 DNA-binding IclR family transcriptional regulator [Spelaeicoccus albus]